MKIKVLSREAFEQFKSDEPFVAISISDPNSEKVSHIGYEDILRLSFHDVDKRNKQKDCKVCKGTGKLKIFSDINDGHCYSCTDKIDIILFDELMARKVLEFVKYYQNKVRVIVVHCEAGISRSAGVAGALSLIYNGTDQYYFDHYVPNMYVYRKILNCYMDSRYA